MKLRLLEISNFRGIKTLTWKPAPGFNLLLGCGDSGKTTILDAIDYVLSPRWNLSFTDTDFYNSDTTVPICIRATVGDLPTKLKGDLRLETHFRGWFDGELHDEPQDDGDVQDEPVLTVQLEVTDTLEPAWTVVTDREVEIRPTFRSPDREQLGVVRVGAYVDRHLSWGRGSALSQYSDSIDNLNPVFAQVRRDTQSSFAQQELPELRAITSALNTQAQVMGVQVTSSLQPGLEITALQSSASAVGLFDGDIPTRQMGLGSRRLLVTTMQLERTAEKSLLLVDEIESALEPHRIRRLIRALSQSQLQLIVSTHSPIAVQESAEQTVFVVRRNAGIAELLPIAPDIKSNLKKSPYAVLAKRVLVCEGKTEQGFIAACRELWEAAHHTDLDALGIADAYGEGSPNGGRLALAFARSRVSTCFYVDADRGLGISTDDANAAGLRIFTYEPGANSERAFFSSLSDDQLQTVLEMIETKRVPNMRSVLEFFFEMPAEPGILWDSSVKPKPGNPDRITTLSIAASGNSQKDPKHSATALRWTPWLKDIEIAKVALGSVIEPWDDFKVTQLGKVLESMRLWCYEQ